MVVVETEREPHALDRGFARSTHDDGAVGKLSCLGDLKSAVDLKDRPEDAPADDPRRVAAEPG